MAEVRAHLNETNPGAAIRAEADIKDAEFSFCPGEGWLAVRYVFATRQHTLPGLSPAVAFPDAGMSSTILRT